MEHAWLTTLRRDGAPRLSRVWFVEQGGALWIATAGANLKVADIQRDCRVAVAVEGRHGASHGVATIEEIDRFPEVIDQFARQYSGWDAASSEPDGPRVLIRVERATP